MSARRTKAVGMEALAKAAEILGSKSALACAVSVTPSAVSLWLARGGIPAEHCPSIERATNGAVRCEDIRPDVDWAVLRTPREQAAT